MRQQFDEIIKEMTESLGNPDDELILSLKAKRDEVDDFLDEEEGSNDETNTDCVCKVYKNSDEECGGKNRNVRFLPVKELAD